MKYLFASFLVVLSLCLLQEAQAETGSKIQERLQERFKAIEPPGCRNAFEVFAEIRSSYESKLEACVVEKQKAEEDRRREEAEQCEGRILAARRNEVDSFYQNIIGWFRGMDAPPGGQCEDAARDVKSFAIAGFNATVAVRDTLKLGEEVRTTTKGFIARERQIASSLSRWGDEGKGESVQAEPLTCSSGPSLESLLVTLYKAREDVCSSCRGFWPEARLRDHFYDCSDPLPEEGFQGFRKLYSQE